MTGEDGFELLGPPSVLMKLSCRLINLMIHGQSPPRLLLLVVPKYWSDMLTPVEMKTWSNLISFLKWVSFETTTYWWDRFFVVEDSLVIFTCKCWQGITMRKWLSPSTMLIADWRVCGNTLGICTHLFEFGFAQGSSDYFQPWAEGANAEL